MRTKTKQTGMTFISLMLLLVILGFLALLVLRLAPIYMENYTIRSVLAGLKQEPGLAQQSAHEIRSMVENRLYINEVRRFDKQRSHEYIRLKKEEDKLKISIDYEVRQHIAANVDALVSFANSVELPVH